MPDEAAIECGSIDCAVIAQAIGAIRRLRSNFAAVEYAA
jgi:hypothetical protein